MMMESMGMGDAEHAPAGKLLSDEDTGEEEAYEDLTDTYLAVPNMRRTWQPLIVHLEVGGLPRGAAVELQPFAVTSAAGQVIARLSNSHEQGMGMGC